MTDPRGFVTTQVYDDRGALLSIEQPDGGVQSFAQTTDGRRWKRSDGLGNETQYSYCHARTFDGCGSDTYGTVRAERPASLASGAQIDYGYGVFDQPTWRTTRNGAASVNGVWPYRTWTYHDVDQGEELAGKLDNATERIEGVDQEVERRRYWNDPLRPATRGLLWRRALPAESNLREEYHWDGFGLDLEKLVLRDQLSQQERVWEYTYDDLGRQETATLWRRESPQSAPEDPLIPITTTTRYDALDRPIEIKNALGDVEIREYDANGQLASVRMRFHNGVERPVRSYEYDEADRVVAEIDAFEARTEFEYDAAGNVVLVRDARGNETRYEYDSMGRQTAMIDARGIRSTSAYDQAGRLVLEVDGEGHQTRHSYDPNGNLVETRWLTDAHLLEGSEPEELVTRYTYWPNGQVRGIANPALVAGEVAPNPEGFSRSFRYDERGLVRFEMDAEGGVTEYRYDLQGRRTHVIDANDDITRTTYNGFGEVVEENQEARAAKRQFDYDEAGNLIRLTDRNGEVTERHYDELNRLTLIDYLADGTSDAYDYSPFGDLASVTAGPVTYSYLYDEGHRLKGFRDSRFAYDPLPGVEPPSIGYSYDAVGNRVQKNVVSVFEDSAPLIETIRYDYDATNQVTGMTAAGKVDASYQYDRAGRIRTRLLSNGTSTTYDYFVDGSLRSLSHNNPAGEAIHRTRYGYDRAGNITSVETSTRTDGTQPWSTSDSSYTYDRVGRLLTANTAGDPSRSRTYTYDHVGNRLTAEGPQVMPGFDGKAHYLYGANNRLKRILDGPADAQPPPQDLAVFAYDDENQQIFRWIAPGPGFTLDYDQRGLPTSMTLPDGRATTYVYDPLGYRIETTTLEGEKELLLLEDSSIQRRFASDGTIRADHLRGAVIDEIVFGVERDEQGLEHGYAYHHDRVQSVSMKTDHLGRVGETLTYLPFGEAVGQPSEGTTRRYTGREIDLDTGLYYYRARYYDPLAGRFVREDPLGLLAGDANLYAYAGNDPLRLSDPTGNCPSCISAVVSAATGAAIRGGIEYLNGGSLSDIAFAAGDPYALAQDLALGAVGAGFVNKIHTVRQLARARAVNPRFPGKGIGDLGERLAGIPSRGKRAINVNGRRRFPDKRDGLDFTEVKNVSEIRPRDAAQINDIAQFAAERGGSLTVLTRGRRGTDVSLIQDLVDSGSVSLGRIPGINRAGAANLSGLTSSGIGAGSAATNAAARAYLYPSAPTSTYLETIYSCD